MVNLKEVLNYQFFSESSQLKNQSVRFFYQDIEKSVFVLGLWGRGLGVGVGVGGDLTNS